MKYFIPYSETKLNLNPRDFIDDSLFLDNPLAIAEIPASLSLFIPKSINVKVLLIDKHFPKALAPSTSILFEKIFNWYKDVLLVNDSAKDYAPDTPISLPLMSKTSIILLISNNFAMIIPPNFPKLLEARFNILILEQKFGLVGSKARVKKSASNLEFSILLFN